jgi:hypothetical protein
MNNNPFQTREPNIIENKRIRTPQREAYAELAQFASESDGQEREIGIVLPVGCGKSGCITLTPFAFKGTLHETERHVRQGEFSSPKPFVISKI